MTKFDAVCTLLDLETREEKLSFVSEFYNNLCTPSTNSVTTGRKSVAKKRDRKPGKKVGRPKKVKVAQETNA